MATQDAPLTTPNVTIKAGRQPASGLQYIFSDDFSSGNKLKTENGFQWTQHFMASVFPSTDNPKNGTHSLKVVYPASDDWTEQGFSLGGMYTRVVLQYDLYIPDGTESWGGAAWNNVEESSGNNNKIIRFHPIGSAPEPMGASYWPSTLADPANPVGDSDMRLLWSNIGTNTISYKSAYKRYVSDAERGVWTHWKWDVKFPSRQFATDAESDGWLKLYKNGALFLESSMNNYESDVIGEDNYFNHGIGEGYLFGWLNNPFQETTITFIDNFRVEGTPKESTPSGGIVTDGFESGDLSSPGYANFNWEFMRATSLVTMSAAGNPTVIYTDTGPANNELTGDTRDWTAQTGENSMRFRYSASNDWHAEQDFEFTAAPATDMWMSFDLRVPTNFNHGEFRTGLSGNNKLFRMYQGAYGTNPSAFIGMEFRPNGSGGSVWYAMAASAPGGIGPVSANEPFITSPSDQGRWMRIWVHCRLNSSPGVPDAILEGWRAWIDAGTVGTPVKHFNVTGLDLPVNTDGGPAGLAHGYLMGYANSAYAEDTEFLMDNVVIGTEALL